MHHFIRELNLSKWNSSEPTSDAIFLDILTGNHQEAGFLEIRTNEECN